MRYRAGRPRSPARAARSRRDGLFRISRSRAGARAARGAARRRSGAAVDRRRRQPHRVSRRRQRRANGAAPWFRRRQVGLGESLAVPDASFPDRRSGHSRLRRELTGSERPLRHRRAGGEDSRVRTFARTRHRASGRQFDGRRDRRRLCRTASRGPRATLRARRPSCGRSRTRSGGSHRGFR